MLLKKQAGWIGIDRGSILVKAVQLTLRDGRMRCSAAAVTPRWSHGSDNQVQRARTECEALRALAPKFSGRRAAALLPKEDYAVEPLQASDNHTLSQEYADSWQTYANQGYSVETKRESVDSLIRGMHKAGLACRVIDAIPLALARALQYAPKAKQGEMIGALDIGYSSSTFIVSRDGLALYVRKLPGLSMSLFIEAVGGTASQSESLILKHGLKDKWDSNKNTTHVAIERVVSTQLLELEKTLLHLRGKLKHGGPSVCYLFGVGALIPGLGEAIGQALETTTDAWTAPSLFEDSQVNVPQCLLGPAIALSALSWEGNA